MQDIPQINLPNSNMSDGDQCQADPVNGRGDVSDPILPTRALDDPWHFMDRLLRLLSKKHSAFRAFAHNFSAAIFIRDQEDVAAVKAVLEKKAIDMDYALRAKSQSMNRRIRKYIPERHQLVRRLEALFAAYRHFRCTQTNQYLFPKDAEQMAERLLDTARQGFLSDPKGIPLYFLMGVDQDGLQIYRTIRGTNSVEGGVHMAVRRIFGALQASPELAELILANWMLRRNKTVSPTEKLFIQNTNKSSGWLSKPYWESIQWSF